MKNQGTSGDSSDDGQNLNSVKAEKVKKTRNFWPLKILVITIMLAFLFSIISSATTSNSNLAVSIILLALLILISIVFDGIGVSVTSCDLAPLNAMASRKVPYSKRAIWLVKNAEKVNNICSDVIGDICGIVSGACGVAIVASIISNIGIEEGSSLAATWEFWLTIGVSSLVAGLTVGGKAFVKRISIRYSREMVMFTAKIITLSNPKNWSKKNRNNDTPGKKKKDKTKGGTE